ncbi:UNVERIFIED_CONTAM: putative ABC transport system ATP-binding protein [Acetivibrio alkalicellulosi]
MNRKYIIKTNNLCKTYTSGGIEFQALKNINLEIYQKDFTAIMGSSGSGKSTLLYLLSGLDIITSGEVCLNDTRIDTLNEKQLSLFRRKNIGFVFQDINLVPNLTLLENILIPGYLVEKDRKKVQKNALSLLDTMGLKLETNRLPSQVSGGQQQRGAIARALVNSPSVLFADEPTGNLNSSQEENVLEILSKVNENGQTVIMVTHDVKSACRANRVLYIKDGELNGDLLLGKYSKNTLVEREKELLEWLTNRGW